MLPKRNPLAKLRSPIGFDLGEQTLEEIALAVIAAHRLRAR
jgi:xanthine/CO dehydrogenase XdhC/CoxF family maturation factor